MPPDDFTIAFDQDGDCPEHDHRLVLKRVFSEGGTCPLGDAGLVKSLYNLGEFTFAAGLVREVSAECS